MRSICGPSGLDLIGPPTDPEIPQGRAPTVSGSHEAGRSGAGCLGPPTLTQMRMRLDQVLPVVVLLVTGLVVTAMSVADGSWVSAIVSLPILAGLAWWGWPARRGRHISHEQAQATAADEDVIVYWRPGCTYCARLKLGLRGASRNVSWVNIWQDPEAAAFVASKRDGNETVPTAVTGAGATIPATAESIKSQLAAR